VSALAASLPSTAMAQGMPQLNFSTPLTTSQVVWGAIIFVLLYVLLMRWALPQVATVLDDRATVIARDLETAREAKHQADAAVAELMRATAAAHAQAQARIAEAVAVAKEAAARQSATQAAQLEKQLAEAEQRIAAARRAALGALREVATETTVAVVARLTGHPADAAAVARRVDAAMAAREPA
jgi:F-type H+-transporting ATPase subunit b